MNDERHEIRTENELKKNEMERILETMRSEIIAILALSPHAGYAWKGTTTDLLEVINAVVMSCELFDENGRRYTFGRLTHAICLRLNRHEPHNPRSYLTKARQRKNLHRPPLMRRYEAALHHSPRPLFNHIVKK